MLAGPTEAVIVSENGDARFIAADLVAQAEHDPETLLVFLTTSKQLALAVAQEAKVQSANNPIAKQALSKRGYIFVARDIAQAMEATNQLAAEHLTVDEGLLDSVTNAGSVFVGNYAAQSFGDYASGPESRVADGRSCRSPWRT